MGVENARAAQAAVLSTRKAKEYGVDETLLEFRWSQRAAQEGFTVETLDEILAAGLERRRRRTGTERDREFAAASAAKALLLGERGLTEHASTFTEKDVLRALAAALPDGAPIGRVLSYARDLLEEHEIVRLPDSERVPLTRNDVIQRWRGAGRGRVVPAVGKSEARYSTRSLQKMERELVQLAVDRQASGCGQVALAHVRDAVGRLKDDQGVKLIAEQALMVDRACLSGDFVTVVNAAAGCGKTTAMGAAADAWQQSGHRVIGMTLAAKAAGILQDETAVPCFTAAQLMHELRSDRWAGFAPNTVVIVDEASMVGTRTYAKLAAELSRVAGCKLVLVGDSHQLPEVDAGGAFRGLMRDGRLRPIELAQNMRQLDPAEQERLRQLRRGSVADAIRSYGEAGKITWTDTADAARDVLAADWSRKWLDAADVDGDVAGSARARAEYAMLAATNLQVEDLNRRARLQLADAGILTGPAVMSGKLEFQVGEHVVTREVVRRSEFHVLNGERWVVTAVDPAAGALTLDLVPTKRHNNVRQVTVPSWYLEDGRLQHGYALTVNVAQGSTLTGVHGLGSSETYRQLLYTQASRPTDYFQLYLAREPEWADEACERQYAPGIDRGQLPLELGELGELISTAEPLDEFVRIASKARGDAMSIDTVSPADPTLLGVPGRRPAAQELAGRELQYDDGFGLEY